MTERVNRTSALVSEMAVELAEVIQSNSQSEANKKDEMKELRNIITENVKEENCYKAKVGALEEVKEKLIKCPELNFDEELEKQVGDAKSTLGSIDDQLKSHETFKDFDKISKQ